MIFIIKTMIIFIGENFTQNILKKTFEYLGLEGKYSFQQFKKGMEVELEHGSRLGQDTDITGNSPVDTAKIVLAHLKEDEGYYDKLAKTGL